MLQKELLLAGGAEVSAASTDYDAFDRCRTGAAGLAGARVDAVVQLEEARDSFGVDVVGDG
jgi:hypothetical protein